jgi:hypothetical protein
VELPEFVPPKVAAKLLGRHLSSIYRTIDREGVPTIRTRDGVVVRFRDLADADARRKPGRPRTSDP